MRIPIREFVDLDHGEGGNEACESKAVERSMDVGSGSLLFGRMGGLQYQYPLGEEEKSGRIEQLQ
jgi:hypothetical protein